MAKRLSLSQLSTQDGASQASRHPAALDPGYVSVDERSPGDLLAFVREYAKQLAFHDERDRPVDTWRGFMDALVDGAPLTIDEIVAYMREPERFQEGARAAYLGRPHFALLLTFLELLGHAREQIDGLTERHLQHYYERVLRMTLKPPEPDRVHVLFQLAPDEEHARLPAGTELDAGEDSQGQPLVYRTDRELIVNRAEVGEIRSVYAHRETTRIRDVRAQFLGSPDSTGLVLLEMLSIALGEPSPGDALPAFGGRAVDEQLLRDTHALLRFAPVTLFIELFDLSELMELLQRRRQSLAEWNVINAVLQGAARARLGNPAYVFQPADPRNFDANLAAAIGAPPDFSGLPNVESMTELHEQRERDEVQLFIAGKLHLDLPAFESMMAQKIGVVDREWRAINDILERAGRRKRADRYYRLEPSEPTDFEANFQAAVGPISAAQWPQGTLGLAGYHERVQALEAHFWSAGDDVVTVTSLLTRETSTDAQWEDACEILEQAFVRKALSARRRALAELCQPAYTPAHFDALVSLARGDTGAPGADGDDPLAPLRDLVGKASEWELLARVRSGLTLADGSVHKAEWEEVFRIIDGIQRRRERLPDPVARKVVWRNLYSYEDATAVTVSLGLADDKTPRWRAFGRPRRGEAHDRPPPEVIGWAIRSPLLLLGQGQRVLTLTLGFRPDAFDAGKVSAALARSAFRIQISTGKGWLDLDAGEFQVGPDYRALCAGPSSTPAGAPIPAVRFELTIAQDADPIVALPAEEPEPESPWPALRLMLRQQWNIAIEQFVTDYEPFRDLILDTVHLHARVSGLQDVELQNDDGTLDAKKPFEPFGPAPMAGTRLYLGHPELLVKQLSSLAFDIEWMGAPKSLSAHYRNYDVDPHDFAVHLAMVDNRVDHVLASRQPLFSIQADGTTRAERRLEVPDVRQSMSAAGAGYRYARRLDVTPEADIAEQQRYFVWELGSPDLQHETYPALAVRKSIELGKALSTDATAVDAADYQVNTPYTPKIKRMTVSYTAHVEVAPGAPSGDAVERLTHIHPFGESPVQRGASDPDGYFLPRHEDEGELYLGISRLSPPSNLALLFQMAEGSADPDIEPAQVTWSYLDGDRFRSLHHGNIQSDSTRGLLNSGILELALDPVAPSTRLGGEYYWLRATIPDRSASICNIMAIRAQAVSATFADRGNAPDHHAQPLPAGRIESLVEPVAEIDAVEQPYTSYGGRMREQTGRFHTRVSERLRHKHRALTSWDYERLVLDQFPQLFRVKCLPAGDPAKDPEALGLVRVMVIPNIKNQLPFDPFEPKVPANLLADICAFLADKVPAYARVEVRNADYLPVQIALRVRLRPGYDEGFHTRLLGEEINRFLAPWAYEDGADIPIGGQMFANSIVDFVDRRAYIDHVVSIRLTCAGGLVSPVEDPAGHRVSTTRPTEVLVPSREHVIGTGSRPLVLGGPAKGAPLGIGYMEIGAAFIVG